MSNIDLSHYKDLYLQTSEEQLRHIDEGLLLLQQDATSKEGFDGVYINAHTIVSKSMLMGYKHVGVLSQKIEKLFFAIKEGKIQISSDLLVSVTHAAAALHTALDAIKKDNSQIDVSAEVSALEKYFPSLI